MNYVYTMNTDETIKRCTTAETTLLAVEHPQARLFLLLLSIVSTTSVFGLVNRLLDS